jgi:glycosyltransferase involved in cell wall biosynthesis
MKIIVSHIEKQHVNALLSGLWKQGVLKQFFTSIATNKITPPQYLSEKWRKTLQKRAFTDIDSRIIEHFPLIALVSKLIKSDYWRTFIAYKWYDRVVAQRLKSADFDIFIGYENCNLLSFKAAKQRGKITVLDLAAIHHSFQNPVLIKLGTYQNTKELDRISAQKDQAFAYTDYILTLSNFAEYTLIESGFPANRIYKTYLGVNHLVFKPKIEYNTEGLSDIGFGMSDVGHLPTSDIPNPTFTEGSPNRAFELYFVGTMTTRKGLPFLMNVHKTLLERGLNIRLTLIGPIDDFATPTEETPQYRYFPFLSHAELVKMHHDLDLFVFPSYLDSWGQVVVEAMACGSPVLVSERTGAKDAVEKGGGHVLPIDDLTAWVSAIEQFYHNRSLLEKIGKQAAIIAQNYTWEAYHQQVVEAMKAIFQRRLDTSKPLISNILKNFAT